MIELIENEIIKQRREELVQQWQRERLATSVQRQQPSLLWKVRLWSADRLIALGNRLQNQNPAPTHAATVGEP